MKLIDKVAIIVGGGEGIGKAIALTFSGEGAQVTLVGRGKPKIESVRQEIIHRGGNAIAVSADVTDASQVNEMVEKTTGVWGKVDILVNNAGFRGETMPIHEMDERNWEKVIAVNLRAPFLCCKAVLKCMIKQRSGSIISISGTAGKEGMALRGALSAAKWGVLGLTKTIAKEAGPFGVRANVICPGGVDDGKLKQTIREMARGLHLPFEQVEKNFLEQTPLRKWATPEDIAKAALFLASSDSSHITGEAINVSGGEVMH